MQQNDCNAADAFLPLLREVTPHLLLVQRHEHAHFLASHASLDGHVRAKVAKVRLRTQLARQNVHALARLDNRLIQLLGLLNLQVENVRARLRADLQQVLEAFGDHEDCARALHAAKHRRSASPSPNFMRCARW
jgi:hypothetical protein